MLAWFDTEDARHQARRLTRRRGLDGYDAMSRNLLDDAKVATWLRMQSDEPLQVDRPGAYGTTVLRSVLRRAARGRRAVDLVDPTETSGPLAGRTASGDEPPEGVRSEGDAADTSGDELRLLLERHHDGRSWLTSAALSYLTLLQHPEARPADAPWPRSGATKDQARCWPSLWFAGEREVFASPRDDRDATRLRRTRSRRINDVLTRVQHTTALYRLDLEGAHGGEPSEGDHG